MVRGWLQRLVRAGRIVAYSALLVACTQVIHNEPINQPLGFGRIDNLECLLAHPIFFDFGYTTGKGKLGENLRNMVQMSGASRFFFFLTFFKSSVVTFPVLAFAMLYILLPKLLFHRR